MTSPIKYERLSDLIGSWKIRSHYFCFVLGDKSDEAKARAEAEHFVATGRRPRIAEGNGTIRRRIEKQLEAIQHDTHSR